MDKSDGHLEKSSGQEVTTEDGLSQAGLGFDEEGIVNFLSDAIGQDVGTEVLREFSHSDAFAELMDVVTSSLISNASTTSSRRESQEPQKAFLEACTDEPNESAQTDFVETFSEKEKKTETALRSSISENDKQEPNTNIISEQPECSDKKPESRKSMPSKNNIKQNDDDLCASNNASRKIQNRLKICLKPSVSAKDKKNLLTANEKSHCKRNIKNKDPGTLNANMTKPRSTSNRQSIDIQQILHKTCAQVHCDTDFISFRKQFNLDPCCVILWDLLYMGKDFRDINCLGGGGDPSLSYNTVKNLVTISDSKIDKTLDVERNKRLCFAKKLVDKGEKKNSVQKPKTLPKVSTKTPKDSNIEGHSKKLSESTDLTKIKNVSEAEKAPKKFEKSKLNVEPEPDPPKNDEDLQVPFNEPSSLQKSKTSSDGSPKSTDLIIDKIKDVPETDISLKMIGKNELSVVESEPEKLQDEDVPSKESSSPQKNKTNSIDHFESTDQLKIEIVKDVPAIDNTPKNEKNILGGEPEHEPFKDNTKVPFNEQTSPQKRKIYSIDSSKSESDDDEEELIPRKINKTDSKRRECDIEATSSTEMEKNQKFERQRDKDDMRAKKFDKFEYERQRKFSDQKKEKGEKHSKAKFKPEEHFNQGKSFAKTFRIPKKNTYEIYGTTEEDLKISTPLAKQDLPSENLKFERFKKGKGEKDEKEPKFKRTDWIPRHKRFENKSKIDFKSERHLPQLEVKLEPEPEPTWGDEGCAEGGEGEGSFFGDRSTDSPPPPLSEVQVGELAFEVSEFLRDGTTVELPSLEDFPCITDATAQKCAWWFAKSEKDPPTDEDAQMQDLDDVQSSYGSDCGSDVSFAGNVSNPGVDDDCQVNEISSTNYGFDANYGMVRDPDKVDEYCGRSLLQAKLRSGIGDNFQNIFDLRSGALYEKENFQAKCNLCNQLIVGKRDLAVHVRGISHKEKLRKLDSQMGKAEEVASEVEKEKISQDIKNRAEKCEVTDKITATKEKDKDKSKIKDNDDKEKKKVSSKKNGTKESEKEKPNSIKKEVVIIKREPVEMERGRTSTGLSIKVPVIAGSSKRRSRSPVSRRRSRSRHRSRSRSRSRSRERRRRRSKSPVCRIPRSPPEHLRRSGSRRSRTKSPRRRSRSKSPRHLSSRKRRSSSEERVQKFLARTRRSKSPANGYHSKRGKRTRTRSRSPQISMKKDNREFHEKLALTADGKWTEEMEKRWKLMEAEEAMFREQFYDRRKLFISSPEEHPKYAEEWTRFWERRYQEVEQAGKDPDTYDYITEWKEFWAKRVNLLLQDEADSKIREIKRKYGMDFESLSKLRKLEAKPLMKTELIEMPFQSNATASTFKLDTIGTASSISDRASLEDFSARSMSISGSEHDSIKMKKANPSKPRSEHQRKPSVTVEDFKSTWEALTRPKLETEAAGSLTDGLNIITPKQEFAKILKSEGSEVKNQHANLKRRHSQNRSDIASSSDASYDFDGFDLVQVLRLMCKCEDQLSFLAPKVLEYFRVAEEMELAKNRGSNTLLDNEEFVSVLFQSRDRFMTMIRSNILSKDVLKSLNLTVYALNAILDAPQCQRFRPQLPTTLPGLETPVAPVQTESILNKSLEAAIDTGVVKNKAALPPHKPAADKDEIAVAFSKVPEEQKIAIAGMVSQYLVSIGHDNISDSELKSFLAKFLIPLVPQSSRARKLSEEDSLSDISGEEVKPDFLDNMPEFAPKTVLKNELDTHSTSARLYGVTSSRVVGSALPTLPTGSYKAGRFDDLRVPASYVDHHSNETRNSRTRRDSGGGRTSPFSRRDYSGNPIANTGRH